jgi:hypothetical protein
VSSKRSFKAGSAEPISLALGEKLPPVPSEVPAVLERDAEVQFEELVLQLLRRGARACGRSA